jgi:hypothetical protein
MYPKYTHMKTLAKLREGQRSAPVTTLKYYSEGMTVMDVAFFLGMSEDTLKTWEGKGMLAPLPKRATQPRRYDQRDVLFLMRSAIRWASGKPAFVDFLRKQQALRRR